MAHSILLVEDNTKLARLLKKRLEDQGYDVTHESRGDKAVYRIIRQQPDLVILDIMLPGMDGKQVCQSVRNDYRGRILMLTSLDDDYSEVASLNLGADDYLTKPVAGDVLKAHLSALLRRPSLADPLSSLTFGILHIDLVLKQVAFDACEVELSPSEFALLELLAVNNDTTLSRDSITRVLRGHEYDGIDRSIDIRVSRLRKIFKDNEKRPQKIKTVHGRGYMLVSTAWKNR